MGYMIDRIDFVCVLLWSIGYEEQRQKLENWACSDEYDRLIMSSRVGATQPANDDERVSLIAWDEPVPWVKLMS